MDKKQWIKYNHEIVDNKPNYKKLHTVLRKLIKKPDYQKLYRAVHKYGDKFVVNVFDALVDKLSSIPVIISVNLAIDKVNHAASVKKGHKTFDEIQKIAKETSKNHSNWWIWDSKAELTKADFHNVVQTLDTVLIAPLAGKSDYDGKNIKKASAYFKNHIKLMKHDYQANQGISLSKEMKYDLDPAGGRLFSKYMQKIDRDDLSNIKKHHFSYVTDFKNLEKAD